MVDEGDRELFERYTAYTADPTLVTRPTILAFCGVMGLGRLLAEGETDLLEVLQRFASDPRWRMFEAVTTALQRWGDKDMDK